MKPLLVIGLDAAEASLIERWAGEGLLPNLRRAAREGSRIRLANSLNTLPGAIWPELNTGRSGGKLGLFYHPRQVHTGESALRPIAPGDVDPSAYYWSAASRAGKRVAVVDVPQAVRSAELDGVQVFEWGLHDRNFDVATDPPELLRELNGRHGVHPVSKCDRHHGGTEAGYRRLLEDLLEGVRMKTGLALDVLGRDEWDLFTCAFGESHCVGHQFWHFFDATHPAHEPEAPDDLRNAIPSVYRAIDEGVGAIVDAAGDGASVVVVASHGMGPKIGGPQLLPEVLARLGLCRRELPQEWRVNARATVPKGVRAPLRRLVPDALWTRLQPLIGARRGELDLAENRAIAVRNNRCGAIRLNLAGREPRGVVRPGQEAEALLGELTRELSALRHPARGEPIVERVVAAEEAFGPEHHPDVPDLMIVFRRDLGILEACESPRVGTVEVSTRPASLPRTGDHTAESRMWIVAPGFPAGAELPDANVLDVAPTVLDLLGVRPGQVDGRALRPVRT